MNNRFSVNAASTAFLKSASKKQDKDKSPTDSVNILAYEQLEKKYKDSQEDMANKLEQIEATYNKDVVDDFSMQLAVLRAELDEKDQLLLSIRKL